MPRRTARLRRILAAMLPITLTAAPLAACGTSDGGVSAGRTISSYDVSDVRFDERIAAMLPASVTDDGVLTVGTNPSYAPAEFLAADGRTALGYDMDLARALGRIFGLDVDIVASNFETIIPAVGSKYDLGISAFTVTRERLGSVDFVTYFTAGMSYAVATGNPRGVDVDDLCGRRVTVQTGTVEETNIDDADARCRAQGRARIAVQSFRQQADATTAVVVGKADVFFADSPVVGYAIEQTGNRLERLGGEFDAVPNAIAIRKGDSATVKAVQAGMQKLMDDGTYLRILRHWGVQSGAIGRAEINPTD